MLIVVPLTSRYRDNPLHVLLNPPEGGARIPSFIKCEDVRAISVQRLLDRWGSVRPATLALVEDRLRIVLGL